MYKLITLIFAACAGCTIVHAQAQGPSSFEEIIRMVRGMNTAQNASVAKTTAVKQRVTGWRSANAAGTVFDSMRYVYDFGRGSDFDFDDMAYYDFPLYPNIYDEKYIRFDSAYKVTGSPRTFWMRYVNDKLMHHGGESATVVDSIDWVYNALGYETAMRWERRYKPALAWSSYLYYYYEYDAAGRVVKDSSQVKKTPSEDWEVKTISYSTAGLVDTITCISSAAAPPPGSRRYVFTYTGALMTGVLTQKRAGPGIWKNYLNQTTTYSGSQVVSRITEEWNGSSWVLQGEEYRHLNANGLPDSIYAGTKGNIAIGTYADTFIKKVTYNSFGNPVTIDYYNRAMTFEGQQRYWYQEYDPTAINDITTAKALTVYPNPANGQLHIAAEDLKPGNIKYIVTNALGQSALVGSNKHEMTVDIRQLLPGMYWLQLQDAEGEIYRAGFLVD